MSPDIERWRDELKASLTQVVDLIGKDDVDREHLRKSDFTPVRSTFREPRLAYIKGTLENLLADEDDIAVAGFRVKELREFATEQVHKIKWNLGAISSVCNLDCDFCYRYGSPKGANGVLVMEGRSMLSVEEAKTRIEIAKSGTGLVSTSADLGEDFANPRILDIYREIRASDPYYVIDTTTHGGFLTEEVVSQLAELKPVDLCVSLNTSDRDLRRVLMKDQNPEIAIGSLALLQKYELWYSVSIVAWPSLPDGDLERSIRFADSFSPRVIRVQLPGRSRFHPSTVQYDRQDQWNRITELLRDLQRCLSTPIYWQPYMYGNDPLEPRITGAIRGSPAFRHGVRAGDLLRSVDGEAVGSREDARWLLYNASRRDTKTVIEIASGDSNETVKEIEFSGADWAIDRYPYAGPSYNVRGLSFGIVINQGIHVPSLVALVVEIVESGVKCAFLIASAIMQSSVRNVVEVALSRYCSPPEVYFVLPEADYFGGDIVVADLLTLSDCESAVLNFARHTAKEPEVVYVPSSMLESGVDLVGRSIRDMERRLGVPVRIAKHPRILD